MEFTIIAAVITGVCTIIAAIIAAIVTIYQIKTNKNKDKIFEKAEKNIDIPIQKHPTLLNPDEYDIEDENFFITLGGLLQQSRNPKDVTLKKITKD